MCFATGTALSWWSRHEGGGMGYVLIGLVLLACIVVATGCRSDP
jgi:hypothetical protein